MACFIFDCDGTLVNDELLHLKAVDIVLRKNFNVSFKMEWHKHIVGTGSRHVIEFGLKKNGIPYDKALLDRLLVEKENAFIDIVEREGIDLIPGVNEFLEEASSKGITLVVGSGLDSSIVKFLLKKAGISHFFKSIIGGEGKRRKPNPDVFIEACKSCPDNCKSAIVFEDSIVGVKAAKSAGAKAVAVLSNSEFTCSDFNADMCISNFKEGLRRFDEILSLAGENV